MSVTTIIIKSLGTVPKGLEKKLEEIEIRGRIETSGSSQNYAVNNYADKTKIRKARQKHVTDINY